MFIRLTGQSADGADVITAAWSAAVIDILSLEEIPRDFLASDIAPTGKGRCDKQRVLMHRHQGLNVRHGLCHIYMRYLYIYELFIAFVCFVVCSLL